VLHPGERWVGPVDAVRGGATGDDSEGVKKRAQTQREGKGHKKGSQKMQGRAAVPVAGA